MSRAEGGDASAQSPVWHSLPVETVFDRLSTDEDGLSPAEAERRREKHGGNVIQDDRDVSPLSLFVSQFQDWLIYLLLLAAVLSVVIGVFPSVEPRLVDAGLILAILLGNGIFGFVQDYRAEQSLQKLRDLSTPDAMVIRDGEKLTIDAADVVPGDVLVLEQGDAIPADARLIEAVNLETMEAALTGESANVEKTTSPVEQTAPVAERDNLVLKGTNVVAGHGRAVVVGTGMDTEVGSIATHLREAEDEATPFQKEVDDLGKRIGVAVLGLIGLIAVVQVLFTAASPLIVVLTAVTLAVAAVPEGLPAVVTLTLALGSRRMVNRNALVRRLPVVESLGSIDLILTDKTGTLTENRMTVRKVYAPDRTVTVTGTGYETDGEFRSDAEAVDSSFVEPVLQCGVVCNNAERAPESASTAYYGDPTEVALLIAGEKAGVRRPNERVREIPFSSDRRRMSVVVREAGEHRAYVKGAPESVLDRCDRVLVDGCVEKLTPQHRQRIEERTEAFAGDALRVLGFARREVADPTASDEEIESGLVFLGLQGMLDPPRSGVDEAVDRCRNAGIRVVMATGDDARTASAVGAELGIDSSETLTGPDIDERTDSALRDDVRSVDTFARVDPGQKVRILRALQDLGYTVAMTGDGVNDAPGLRSADVGISMGVRGTDIAQEASDMVLQDDNFVTIVEAVAEGRRIFDNIRKFVNLLLSANTGEVLTVFFGVLVGSLLFTEQFAAHSEALILTPVMLLWINLITDGLPALALGVDPRAENILERAPRESGESVVDGRIFASILTIGVTITLGGLVVFFSTLDAVADLATAQTVLFSFFVVSEMGIIQVIRRRYGGALLSNWYLVGAVIASLLLHGVLLYTPIAPLFGVVPLGVYGWIAVLTAVAGILVVNSVASRAFDRLLD